MHSHSVLAILTMALVTYMTRISGFLLLNGRQLSPKIKNLMDILPGCVLISILAPLLASGSIANIVGISVTALAASRLPLLPTMLIGIATTGLLRTLF